MTILSLIRTRINKDLPIRQILKEVKDRFDPVEQRMEDLALEEGNIQFDLKQVERSIRQARYMVTT